MTQLRDQLKKTLSAELPNMQSQLQPVKQILDQYGNAFTSGSQKAQQAVQKTEDAVKKASQTAQKASDDTKSVLDEEAKRHEEITRVIKKQAEAEAAARKAELADVDINASPGFPKSHFKTAAEIYAEQFPSKNVSPASPTPPTSSSPSEPTAPTKPPSLSLWQRFMNQYDAILDHIKAAMSKVGLYGKESSLFGDGPSIFSKALNSVKSSLDKVTSSTNSATSATRKWGKQAESSANTATSGFAKARNMVGRMLLFSVTFRVFSGIGKAVQEGFQDMAQGSSAANATLSQLATSFLYLKNSIASAFMPAINAIAPAVTWITDKLAGLFNMLGMLNASIFGGATTITVAKKAGVNYAETLEKTGAAAKKAAKDANESVLSFDKLNKLQAPKENADSNKSDTKPGMPAVGDMFTTEKIPANISALGEKIKTELAKWAQYAQPTVAAFQRLVKSMEPLKTFAARGAEDFYNDFLTPLGKWALGKGLPDLLDTISRFNKDVHWDVLNKGLDNLWKALEPFAETVGAGLNWFFRNVCEPFAVWAMNQVVPVALNIIKDAIILLNNAVQAARPMFLWFYDSFLKRLGGWTGNVVVQSLNSVDSALVNVGNWIKSNQGTFQNMIGILGIFFAAWKGLELVEFITNAGGVIGILGKLANAIWAVTGAKIADQAETIEIIALYVGDFIRGIAKGTVEIAKQIIQWAGLKAAKISDIVQTAAQTAATKLETLAQGALNLVLDANPIALVVIAIAALVAAIVVLWNKNAAFRDFIIGVWNGIQSVVGNIGHWFQTSFVGFFVNSWHGIQGAFGSVGSWFQDVFSSAWNGIKWAWSGVTGWFGGIWNDILGFFQPDMITNGFKNAWNALTSWKIPMPHIWWGEGQAASGWMKDALSALHLPTALPSFNIDWYAKGGVFDAQSVIGVGEYAGAQSNPEIVTPQKIMYDTVVEANGPLVDSMAGLVYQVIQAIKDYSNTGDLYVDGDKLGKHVAGYFNSEFQRTGRSPIRT